MWAPDGLPGGPAPRPHFEVPDPYRQRTPALLRSSYRAGGGHPPGMGLVDLRSEAGASLATITVSMLAADLQASWHESDRHSRQRSVCLSSDCDLRRLRKSTNINTVDDHACDAESILACVLCLLQHHMGAAHGRACGWASRRAYVRARMSHPLLCTSAHAHHRTTRAGLSTTPTVVGGSGGMTPPPLAHPRRRVRMRSTISPPGQGVQKGACAQRPS